MTEYLRFRHIMQSVLFGTVILTCSWPMYAQHPGFVLLPSGQPDLIYHQALSSASLETYRLRDKDRILKFDSGVEFKLLSAELLESEGVVIDPELYSSFSNLHPDVSLTFHLLDSNTLGVTSQVAAHSKLAKIGAGYPEKLKKVIFQEQFDSLPIQKQQFILERTDHYILR